MPILLLPRQSRRGFLASLAVGGAAVAAGSFSRADEPARRSDWYALLADTHIAADPQTRVRGEVMTDNLRAVVAKILAVPERPLGAFVIGDLAYKDGQEADYRSFLALIEPLRKAEIPVYLTLGNHDERAHFRDALSLDIPRDTDIMDKQVGVVDDPGIRFVVLDSLDHVDTAPGLVGTRQLRWLARTLDAAPQTPTIIAVHHNLGDATWALLDTAALKAVLKPRRQVKAVVFGHTHVRHWADDDGLHLINLPAVAYPFTPGQPLGFSRLTLDNEGASIQLHCIGGDRRDDGQQIKPRWRV
jgi:3',5'-cyclic AMP phosphodiesterase CpdA